MSGEAEGGREGGVRGQKGRGARGVQARGQFLRRAGRGEGDGEGRGGADGCTDCTQTGTEASARLQGVRQRVA